MKQVYLVTSIDEEDRGSTYVDAVMATSPQRAERMVESARKYATVSYSETLDDAIGILTELRQSTKPLPTTAKELKRSLES